MVYSCDWTHYLRFSAHYILSSSLIRRSWSFSGYSRLFNFNFLYILTFFGFILCFQGLKHWDVLGELTTTGMDQLYNLGKKLRDRYITTGLLSSEYNSHEVYVRASDHGRTLMSANSLLLGMYPNSDDTTIRFNTLPTTYQAIPIDLVPLDLEVLLRGYKVWFVFIFLESHR